MPNRAVAFDDMLDTFRLGWGATTPIAWPDDDDDAIPPADGSEYVTITIIHSPAGGQRSLRNPDGTALFRRNGTVFVQIFTPKYAGSVLGNTLAQLALDTFDGVTTTNGVRFRDGSAVEIQTAPEAMRQDNFTVFFQYDETK